MSDATPTPTDSAMTAERLIEDLQSLSDWDRSSNWQREIYDRAIHHIATLTAYRTKLAADLARAETVQAAKDAEAAGFARWANESIKALQADLARVEGETQGCHAGRDGECNWSRCPQLRDNEPEATGRHCQLDTVSELQTFAEGGDVSLSEMEITARNAAAIISKLVLTECSWKSRAVAAEAKSARLAWQPIPADFVTLNPARTVMVARVGERLVAQAIRSGIKGGWRHAHCGEALCFEPTHYIEVSALTLPEPSLSVSQLTPQSPLPEADTPARHEET